MDCFIITNFMIIMDYLIIILLIAVSVFLINFYQKKRNDVANKAKCPACRTPFQASDIVREDLAEDGLANSGKVRKLYVVMRCSSCGEEKKLTIYTHYRHHPINGSPAYQYFKEVEQQKTKKDA